MHFAMRAGDDAGDRSPRRAARVRPSRPRRRRSRAGRIGAGAPSLRLLCSRKAMRAPSELDHGRYALVQLDTVAGEVAHNVHKALHWCRRAFVEGKAVSIRSDVVKHRCFFIPNTSQLHYLTLKEDNALLVFLAPGLGLPARGSYSRLHSRAIASRATP